MRQPALTSIALLGACFALAVTAEPKLAAEKVYARHEQSAVAIVLGEARRFFAGHFFTKADVYFHSGYYPSIFDQPSGEQKTHLESGTAELGLGEHEEHGDFLGKPLDCIDQFSRAFFPSKHTHLEDGEHEGETAGVHNPAGAASQTREMLPWLRLTAALDPNRVETYTVGAYWLRTRMNKPLQAEQFLREGLEANPGNPAILFELGRIFEEVDRDYGRARNLWEASLRHWERDERSKPVPDNFLLLQITWQLALLEEKEGNTQQAISYLEQARSVSPNPTRVDERIAEIRAATQNPTTTIPQKN